MNTLEKIVKAVEKGYYSDKFGNVFSQRKKLSLIVSSRGYYNFSVSLNNKRIIIYVHQFVAYSKYGNKAFDNNIVVRHLDGNSLNNYWDNIEIGSPSQNSRDIPENKRISIAINNSSKRRRFTDDEVIKIVSDRKLGFSYSKLCEKYNTSKSTLSYLFNDAYYTKNKII